MNREIATPRQQRHDRRERDTTTRIGQFISQNGIILMTERRDFGSVRLSPDGVVGVNSLIIGSAKEETTAVEHGVQIHCAEAPERFDTTRYIDFDEIEELLAALQYIDQLSMSVLCKDLDDTEVIYITRDRVAFGFGQFKTIGQAFFIRLDDFEDRIILLDTSFMNLTRKIRNAAEHLSSRGALAS